MDTLIQVGVGLVVVGAIFGFSWWLAGVQTNREFGRKERAEKAAEKVRDKIYATRNAYSESKKRMPLALHKLLRDSWDTYRSLSESAWWVRNEKGVAAITARADTAVAAITDAVEHVPTVEELDAETAALNEQLEEAQRDHAEAVAKAEREHAKAIAEADLRLTSAGENVAKALEQIAAEKASRQ